MASPDPTLVTAVFALGKERLAPPFHADAGDDRRHLPAVLSMDCPMVVYTDAAHEALVLQLRGARPTRIHVVDPAVLAGQRLYEPVHRIRQEPAWLAQADWLPGSPQAVLGGYTPVLLTKPLWLYQQARANPFGSSHLYWIDSDLGRTVPSALLRAESLRRLARRHRHFLLLCRPHEPLREVHGFDAAALAQLSGVERTRWVASGAFLGGPAGVISEVAALYSHHLEHSLSSGLMGTDESLLTLLSYAHPHSFDLQFVGRDGVTEPFFSQLAQGWPGDAPAARKLLAELAETWFVSYNTPQQFDRLLQSIERAEPALLRTARRVLLNNSTDASTFADYDAVCHRWGVEQLREGNRGMNGARLHAAELFARGGRHAMFWFEDDMLLVAADDRWQACENGLPRHVHEVASAALAMLQREFADYVKLSFTEVRGAHHTQRAWDYLTAEGREHYFPGVDEAPPQAVAAIQCLGHVPYAVGEACYSNWPHVVSRRGSRRLFLDEQREPSDERSWAARSFALLRAGELRAAVLLASPVHHDRTQQYASAERIEYQRLNGVAQELPEPVIAHRAGPSSPGGWPELPGAIFVSIANYRDSETPHTVRDLFANAKRPDRVFAGVLSQVVPGEDDDCLPSGAPQGHLRELRVHASESLGACWARSRILRELLQGEEFVLQVDSHSRFQPGWDERLVSMLRECPSERALLTTYPPGYRPPDERSEPVATVLAADVFNDLGVLLVNARVLHGDQAPSRPVPAALLSANFLFGPARAFREVPYDPWLYFHGEEISLAVRFWTHGWDLYAPHESVVFHDYTTDRRRPRNWDDRRDWVALNMRSFARIRHLLGIEESRNPAVLRELDRHGLGTERTLAEYEEFADIRFADHWIGTRAADGRFAQPPTAESLAMLRAARASYLQRLRGPGNTFTPVRETRSGDESTLEATAALRPALQTWLGQAGIRSIADAGCGDFHWMGTLELDAIGLYVGFDIVPELIARNQQLYGLRRGHFFSAADIAESPLPACDAVLCRQVLHHMPRSQALRALDNVRASGARYLLATIDPAGRAPWVDGGAVQWPAPSAVLPDVCGGGLGVWALREAS